MLFRSRGARSATCILRILSCAGGRSPSTSQFSESERGKQYSVLHLPDTLHETEAEEQAINTIGEGSHRNEPDKP